jgi:plasmid stability protein
MKTLTLKNLPDDVLAHLRAKAKQNQRSLNNEAIIALKLHALRPERNVAEFLEEARKLRAHAKGSLTIEEIDEARKQGRA